MYQPKFWLIHVKNYPEDLKKYKQHVIAETLEEARQLAESLFGPNCLETDPILDPPSQ